MPDENDKKPDNKYNMDFRIWGKDIVNQDKNKKPKPEPEKPKKFITGVDDNEPPKPREKPDAEYRIISLKVIEPGDGFLMNKSFDIEGEVESISRITRPRILVYPIGMYKGEEDKYVPQGLEAFIDDKTMKFKTTCKYLFEPDNFGKDHNKPADATWSLVVRAEGNTSENTMETEPITFPRKPTAPDLKREDYDNRGA